MIERAQVIGAGRVGSAIAARLRERGLDLDGDEPELVLLCVPDRAIAEVARARRARPVGRARQRRDAARRARRRTRGGSACTRCRRSRARAAPSSSTAPSRPSRPRRTRRARSGTGSPGRSASSRSRSPTASAPPTTPAPRSPRTTSSRSGARPVRCSTAAGAPPEALDPLMRRTIENGFELTGPIARGDWETVDAHLAAIRAERPGARAAVRRARRDDEGAPVRTVREDRRAAPRARESGPARSGSCRRWARSTPATWRCSPPRGGVRHRRRQPLRQPGAVRRGRRPRRLPARRGSATPRSPPRRASTSSSRRPRTRSTRPASRPGSTSRSSRAALEGEHRPGPLPRRRDRLPEALQHRPPATASTSARRTRSRSP